MARRVEWRARLCRAARAVAQPRLHLIVFGNETPAARAGSTGHMRATNSMTRTIALAGATLLLGLSNAFAQQPQTIRVGWTIPAEDANDWMIGLPDRFP